MQYAGGYDRVIHIHVKHLCFVQLHVLNLHTFSSPIMVFTAMSPLVTADLRSVPLPSLTMLVYRQFLSLAICLELIILFLREYIIYMSSFGIHFILLPYNYLLVKGASNFKICMYVC